MVQQTNPQGAGSKDHSISQAQVSSPNPQVAQSKPIAPQATSTPATPQSPQIPQTSTVPSGTGLPNQGVPGTPGAVEQPSQGGSKWWMWALLGIGIVILLAIIAWFVFR